MDETHGNGLLDATASRKRRSSILKSQRPPRTPLTELELNVATPTDTNKSRRVSFSRRTGVAEFITDEATNTWKTIYVEQNKSMESSLNDSARNPPKQTVGHLGKRIFEQQFQEEEFINFGSTLITSNNVVAQELNMSLKGNLTQQFAALERDLDGKNLAAPQTNFELSSFTDHKSKIFGDDLTNPMLGEMSNNIDINFSSLDPVGVQDKCYDLDEIEKDLLKPRSNASNRPFGMVSNVSEQFEIDFKVKQIEVRSDELDMSITDTIRNPQVEEVAQTYKTINNNRTSNMDSDWTLDKENIAINPYVAPKESINFAINEVPDQVLVFDGRRLTIQSEHKDLFDQNPEQDFNKTILPDIDRPLQRKTIVLNLNDDLPNFIDVPVVSDVHTVGKNLPTNRESVQRNNNNDFSTLNVITNKTQLSPHKTIIYDGGANISVTQAMVTNILLEQEKRKTIVYEDESGNLSMTQALPTNVVTASKSAPQNKTILYDVDNISITQAVPMNLLLHNKSIPADENFEAPKQNEFDLSFTQAVPHNMLIANKTTESNKRKTIVYDNEEGDISMTRVLPTNIIISESHNNQKTEVQNLVGIIKAALNKGHICDTFTNQPHSTNVRSSSSNTLDDKKLPTDMSQTEMLSSNIIVNNITDSETTRDRGNEKRLSTKTDKFLTNMSITETIPNEIFLPNNHLTTAVDTSDNFNACDISVTEAVPSNFILDLKENFSAQVSNEAAQKDGNTVNNSRNDIKNIDEKLSRESVCQQANARKTTDEFISEEVPKPLTTIVTSLEEKQKIDKTISSDINYCPQENEIEALERPEYSKSYADMSMTQVLQPNILRKSNAASKRGTIVFDNDEMGDISVTQAIPATILLNEMKSNVNKTLLIFENLNSDPLTSVSNSDGMLTKSEETVASKLNISCVDIPETIDMTRNRNQFADICQIYNNSLASRTLQRAKEELQKSVAETDDGDKDMSIDNISHPETRSLFGHEETLLKSMNYIDQKFETNSLKPTTDRNYKDVFVYQAVTTHNVSKHQGLRTEQGDVKSEKSINKDENSARKSNAGNKSELSLLRDDLSQITDVRKKSDYELSKQNNKISILAELLNMSDESMNMSVDGMDDKNVMVGLESQVVLENHPQDVLEIEKTKVEAEKSMESIEETKNISKALASKPMSHDLEQKEVRSCLLQAENSHRPPLSLNYEQDNPQTKENIKTRVSEIKSDNSIKVVESENDAEDKCLKDVDDTKELLEMLTDFTDKTIPSEPDLDSNKSTEDIAHIPAFTQEKSDTSDASDNKESCEQLQLKISIPVATQEAMEVNESEDGYSNGTIDEETDEVVYKEISLRRRSGHVSRDVIKTLQFDESNDEIKTNSSSSPLRKTALADISCPRDSKAKVIPTYLNDVPEDLKSLMRDLVKPAADLMPFETSGVERINKKPIPTRNKELQTNIVTSSQIDIIDINSYPISESDVILSCRKQNGLKGVEHGSAEDSTSGLYDTSDTSNVQNFRKNVDPKPVLLFDHKNPLNNVILCPSGKTNVHKYSPNKLDQTKSEVTPEKNENKPKISPQVSYLEEKLKEVMKIQRVSTQYNIDTGALRTDEQLNSSKRNTEEQCEDIDNRGTQNGCNLTNAEVNTVIAMKCNTELLQASSSLTLVDDEPGTGVKNKSPKSTNLCKMSPVKVIFKLNDQDETVESSTDWSDADCFKSKKRNYNRTKYDQYDMTVDVTPKPRGKVQKLSTSPRPGLEHFRIESAKLFTNEPNRFTKDLPNVDTKLKRPPTIVQHVTTICKINTEMKTQPMNADDVMESSSGSTLKTETISKKDLKECTSTELTSFTSSNAMKERDYSPSLATVESTTDCDDSSLARSEIEALSFMGRECEWESCEADAWRFLLLRRRLRLTVRVQRDAPDHERSVRPDTPVISITIEPVTQESDAVWCAGLRLACEAMRYECVRCGAGEGAGAGAAVAVGVRDVGALLRRCVGVARAARRWARLMADARAHLAFTLAHCGRILLTVANFHLRRVWEVTMRIELVVEDARELAWPRATHVAVRDVTLGAGGTAAGEHGAPDVRRALARVPHDWGHVPRTIWKVFRHLKNKTEDDEVLWSLHNR